MSPLRLFLPIVLFAHSGFAANWPTWRGPQCDGVTNETNLPLTWSATESVKWKIDLPEPGNSTPIVWGDRIFLTQAVGQRRTLMCLDRKNGNLLWQEGPTSEERERTHGANPFCAASPVTDGERVIAWFGSAGLYAWDLAGKELWHVDLGKQDHLWGYGGSPYLSGDVCYLNFGPGVRSFIVAVDKRTGKEIWRFDVPPPVVKEGPGGGNPDYTGSWATPVIMTIGGRRQLVVGLPGGVFGLDPTNGHELWQCNGLNALVYAQPLLTDGIVLGFGGYNGFSLAAKIAGTGDITATYRLWQEKHNPQRIGSGVMIDGKVYIGSDSGLIQCLDAKTGGKVWDERPQVAGHSTSSWSSIVQSGDRLYLLTKASDTLVFRTGPKFELLAANSLDDGMANASIAVSDGELFVRTYKHLWCIGTGK